MIHYCHFESPIGKIMVAGEKAGLKRIGFPAEKGKRDPDPAWEEGKEDLKEAVQQLEAYFSGKLKAFRLKLAPEGTPFQLSVWQALQDIPYGQTVSYGELARRIGKPKASRAVGAACARNPLPIVIPCHRVIGSTGGLTGFGGGLDVKKALLELERGNR
jgi:methylated-DNA-[protein]-cysteine S-methyltransferase